MKKRVVGLFLVALLFGCEEDRLVKLECVLGDKLVCNEFGQNFPLKVSQKFGDTVFSL